MSFIAILGAGPLGGSVAHRLALRGRVGEIRLIDPDEDIARGKALDILQSSPIDGFSTRLSAAGRLEAAAGASVAIVADAARGGTEYAGEDGLAVLRRLLAIDPRLMLVFGGSAQRGLMAQVVSELHVPPRRVVGSAAVALEGAVRALVALELNGSGTGVQVAVLGAPPHAAVIAWEGASAYGQPLSAMVPPHRLAAISARLPGLWPPGPLALASAAARIAEALANGSRSRHTCFVAMEEPPGRGAVVAVPAELGPGGVARLVPPALSRQERTIFENALTNRVS